MYKCKKCNYETDKISEIANHYQYNHKENKKIICDKCGKEFKNEKGLKLHTKKMCDKNIKKKEINHICPKCGFYITNSLEKHVSYCKGFGPRSKPQPIKEKKSLKGISFDERFGLKKSNEIKKKISEKVKGCSGNASTPEKELIKRKKLSEIAKDRKIGGYKKGSGRGKCGWYKGYWCDSSWELAFVIYNLDHNIKFDRNDDRFEYEWKNIKHKWIPDFIMNGTYCEIKGYWTEQNQAKFDSFKNPLKIYYKNEMKNIIEYVSNKYGKNYTKLYENNKEKSCSICGGYIWKYNKNGICVECIKKLEVPIGAVSSLENCEVG